MTLLCLPHSNGEAERIFSQMNLVKSKIRNRLSTPSVNAVLTVRYGLKRVEKCCYSYELPMNIVNKIGTMAAYTPPPNVHLIATEDEEEDFFNIFG